MACCGFPVPQGGPPFSA